MGFKFKNTLTQKYNRHHPKINLALLLALTVTLLALTRVLLQKQKNTPKVMKINNTPSESPAIQAEKLNKYLTVQAALLGVVDNISYDFQDLTHGQEISLGSTYSWTPASTIKAYVAIEAFRQRNLGLIDFNQTISIKKSNVVATELETDEFPRLREETQTTIKQLVEAMIIQSDNTAYNTLLDILDRRNINSTLKVLGITETVVGEKLNLDNDQFQADLQVPGRQPNTTTAKDLATLFYLLYNHKVNSSEEILGIFKRQKINNMIPALLPPDIAVAHKTGDWAPIYHDGGVVYKPDGPFIFTVFTDTGNPGVIAKMAQVAYYQDPKYVGKSLSLENRPQTFLAQNPRPIYYLNNPPTQKAVLGESAVNEQVLSAGDKFPTLTAEDLGVSTTDLEPGSNQIKNIGNALIIPGSFLYSIKQFFENAQVNLSPSKSSKVHSYINNAKSRLAEINTLARQRDSAKIDQLLQKAEESLKKAADLANTDTNKDSLMIEMKRVNDLHYAVLSQVGKSLPDDQKEQFIDTVYNFYKKNEVEVVPVLKSSIIINPTQQKPIVGVIREINKTSITVQLPDGNTKQVNTSDATNLRSFDKETFDKLGSLKPGSNIAILGSVGSNQKINAQFILNNVPPALTTQHQGIVTEVNPNQNMIKIVDKKGQTEFVQVGNKTSLKSKDTDVTLEGIKAGSQVTVYGTPQKVVTPSQVSTPNISPATKTPVPGKATENSTNTSKQSKQNATPQAPVVELKATSITVTHNSSGAKEEKRKPSPPSQPESSHKEPAPPPPAKKIKI